MLGILEMVDEDSVRPISGDENSAADARAVRHLEVRGYLGTWHRYAVPLCSSADVTSTAAKHKMTRPPNRGPARHCFNLSSCRQADVEEAANNPIGSA